MTDHDQTTLELMYERRKTAHLWRIVVGLAILLVFTIGDATVQALARGRDIAALTAKCGLERP